MREQDMRECVGNFLKARMRAMVLPATLGLGLALAGCDQEALETTDDSGTSGTISQVDAGAVKTDTATGPAPKYIAQFLDANITPEYIAQMPDAKAQDAKSPDAGIMVRYMAPQPDLGQPVLLYMAPHPSS